MKTLSQVRRFVRDYMEKADLPVPHVVLRANHPTLNAQSDYANYRIIVYALPVSKSTLRHECYHVAIALSVASAGVVEQICELAERGAAR